MSEEKLSGYMKKIDKDIIGECAEFAPAETGSVATGETSAAASALTDGAIPRNGAMASITSGKESENGYSSRDRRSGRNEKAWKSIVSVAATVLLFIAGAVTAIVIAARSRVKNDPARSESDSGYELQGSDFPASATAAVQDTTLPATDTPEVTAAPSPSMNDTLLSVVNFDSISYPYCEMAWSEFYVQLPEDETPAQMSADGITPGMVIMSRDLSAYTFTFNLDSTLRFTETQGLSELGIYRYMIYDADSVELYSETHSVNAPVTTSYATRALTEALERIFNGTTDFRKPCYVCVTVSYKIPSEFFTEENELFDYYAFNYIFAVKEDSFGGATPTAVVTSTPELTPEKATPTDAPDVTPDPNVPFVIDQGGRSVAPYNAGIAETVTYNGSELVKKDFIASMDYSQIKAAAPIVYYGQPFSERWLVPEHVNNYYFGTLHNNRHFDGSWTPYINYISDDLSKLDYYFPSSQVIEQAGIDWLVAVVITEKGNYIKSAEGYESSSTVYFFRVIPENSAQASDHPVTSPTSDPSVPVRIQAVAIETGKKLFIGNPVKLECRIYPENYNNGSVSWKIVEGNEYAEIDPASGTLSGIKEGTVKLKAYVEGTTVSREITISVEEKGLFYTPETELDPKYMPEKDPQGINGDIYDQRRYYLVYNMRTPEELPVSENSPYLMDLTYYVNLKTNYGKFDIGGIKVAFYNKNYEYVGYSLTNSSGTAMFTIKNSDDQQIYFLVCLRDRDPAVPLDYNEIKRLRKVDDGIFGKFGETGMAHKAEYSLSVPSQNVRDGIYTVSFVNKQSGEEVDTGYRLEWFAIMADYTKYTIFSSYMFRETGEFIDQNCISALPGLEGHIAAICYLKGGSTEDETRLTEDNPHLEYKIEGMHLTIYVDDALVNSWNID